MRKNNERVEKMKEIRLDVGTRSNVMGESDDLKEIKFFGREIAHHRSLNGQTGSQDDRGTDYTLYQTEKNNYLLHIEDWSRWQGETSTCHYQTAESLEELEEDVPCGLITKAKRELGLDPAEELDI